MGGVGTGAAVVDVTPVEFPVLVNGGMLSRSVDTVKTPVNARAIVLDDGRVVADAPQELHEQAIYQLEGRQYQVLRLDHDNRKAYVVEVDIEDIGTLRHRVVAEPGVSNR